MKGIFKNLHRYVLWLVEKYGGASNIINELTFAK